MKAIKEPKFDGQKFVDNLKFLNPDMIYDIANRALNQEYPESEHLCVEATNQTIFIACWNVEKVNNGPYRFIQAIKPEHVDHMGRLLDVFGEF